MAKYKITIEVENEYSESAWKAVHSIDMLLRGILTHWEIVKVEEIK